MANFRFRLATLLRLRDRVRDERRRLLAEAQVAEDALAERLAQVAEDLDDLKHQHRLATAEGHVNIDRVLSAQRYELVLQLEENLIQQQSATLEAEITKRRQTLIEADRDVKVLEKLRERQHQRFREEEYRRETKEFDDVAGRQYWREVNV